MFQMPGAFAEFERAIIRERVLAGMARARAKGTKSGNPIGRPPVHPARRAPSVRPTKPARPASRCRTVRCWCRDRSPLRRLTGARFEARWRLGQLLQVREGAFGPGRGKKMSQAGTSFRAYLKEIGLNKSRAHEAQRASRTHPPRRSGHPSRAACGHPRCPGGSNLGRGDRRRRGRGVGARMQFDQLRRLIHRLTTRNGSALHRILIARDPR